MSDRHICALALNQEDHERREERDRDQYRRIPGILIMEYLAKISKKARIMELKRRNLKITVLTSNTLYLSRKIRHICACTSQKTMKETRSIRRIQGRPIRRIQNSSYLDLRKKYRLSLKNDMPPRDNALSLLLPTCTLSLAEGLPLYSRVTMKVDSVYISPPQYLAPTKLALQNGATQTMDWKKSYGFIQLRRKADEKSVSAALNAKVSGKQKMGLNMGMPYSFQAEPERVTQG
ncbi:hypothetical protein Tco_0294826 [Tanacetum coccineum]